MVMIVGLLPMALITTTGSELHRPLAVVYIGGFFFAIFLRLIMVPVLYETLMSWGQRPDQRQVPAPPSQPSEQRENPRT
jgi:Cu/Ag efflux pump CusA